MKTKTIEVAGGVPDHLRDVLTLEQIVEVKGLNGHDVSAEKRPKKRAKHKDDTKKKPAGMSMPHWDNEPWHEPVNGAELLDDLADTFNKYLVLPEAGAEALALFTLHAWTIDASDISPFLIIVSPTKQCGKSTLLILLMWLTPKSILAANISGPAMFRVIEDEQPTLLVDEADTFVKEDDRIRGILNSGHTRPAAFVIRCEGEGSNQVPRKFSTWCIKVICSIGGLASTLMDRSLQIWMRRKTKGEKRARRPLRDTPEMAMLRRGCMRWADDNFGSLDGRIPELGDLHNRIADNWEPLLNIADVAGGDWPQRARKVACTMSGISTDDQERGIELLSDIRTIFTEKRVEELSSSALLHYLVEIEDGPWRDWHNGRPISARRVASLLKDYGVKPDRKRTGSVYQKEAFKTAFESYLKSEEGSSDAA